LFKRIASGIVLTLLFIVMLALAFNVQPVKTEPGTIYIRADGSVDPSTAPIQRDGDIYTFIGNIYESIVVEKDNIVIDGAGYALQGVGSGKGIDLSGRTNVTIKNTSIKGFSFGIYLDRNSLGNTISGNNIKNNQQGIQLYGSSNTISENNVANNYRGIELHDCSSNYIFGNNITANTQSGISLEGYGLAPERTRNNIISGNIITKNQRGIGLGQYTRHNSVIGNNITENSWGIEFYGSGNNVSENNFERNSGGIYAFGSGHTISGNNVTSNNHYGILIQDSSNNMLRNNIMVNNKYNFGVKGSQLSNFIHDIDESNTVDGKPVYYWVNKHNAIVPVNVGYVGVVNSTNITIKELELKNNYQGVLLAYTKNSTIANNIVSNNLYGIYFYSSSCNNISQNNITSNNIYGIHLDGSYSNTISENKVANNTGSGIRFDWSHHNIISENNIVANEKDGIWLSQSSDNIIFGNRIENNQRGIELYSSSDNRFYHNYFANNTVQVYDYAWEGWTSPSINVWDDGYPSGGNYWGDYEEKYPNATEIDDSGIWDTPYVIDENNQDNYPLIPEFPSATILLLLLTITTFTLIFIKRKRAVQRLTSNSHFLFFITRDFSMHFSCCEA